MKSETVDQAGQAIALVRAWKAAEDACSNLREPAASLAERSILTALNHASRAGMVLLTDDLTAALSHVDGCAAAFEAERSRLVDARFAARADVVAAGFQIYTYDGVSDLLNAVDGYPELDAFVTEWGDYVAGMVE